VGGQAAHTEGERKGDFLGGKYLLEDCLGIGGMGEVYRATNVSLDRKVAIKLLNKEHTSNEDDVLRFLREARAAAAVRHPNVVDVFDVARDDDGTPFIVQELLSGEDLEQYLGASRGRLGADEALEIMIPVADAVAAAHARSVVHRDLKPANIFLAREGNRIIPKVLDFGACLYQTVGALSAKERRMLIGTPHYMAPEQITTAMDVDARADVWAMGVILYELLAGETPFEAEDANAVLKLVKTRQVLPLRKVAPLASERLEAAVARCLDRDRKKRFPNAQAFRDELEAVKKDLRGGTRKRVDTAPEIVVPSILEKNASPARKDDEPPPSTRVPSLVLQGKPAGKRRGASLLMLSSPDEAVKWDSEPPASSPRLVEARPSRHDPREEPRHEPRHEPKAARTAADVIREAELAGPSSKRGAALPLPPDSGPSLPDMPPQVMGSTRPPVPIEARMREPGAPRDLDLDDPDDEPGLDLDLEPPPSRGGSSNPSGQPKPSHRPAHSSMPPVLDPRIASNAPRQTSDRPATDHISEKPRISRADAREPSLTPALTPSLRTRTPGIAMPVGPPPVWPAKENVSFGAAIIVPAVAAYIALGFAPFVAAPLGHAMRGDSPLASGALAIIALVGAAALAARSLGANRSTGMLIATVGAVLLGIVMIIVTFSASETADLDVPPAAGGIVPFIAPIVPLGLGLAAMARARSLWLSRYDRGEAVKFVAIASFMLFAMLELGPLGATRAATHAAKLRPPPPATTAPP
jgi:eukaryotic-like serine/threonine-protein kinase